MGSPISLRFLLSSFFLSAIALEHNISGESERISGGFEQRILISFKGKSKGSNATLECSLLSSCDRCLYSEKNNEKYRCSETGYHVSLKCVETERSLKHANGKTLQNSKSTLEGSHSNAKPNVQLPEGGELNHSSTLGGGPQTYTTYRSCIPAVNEEKLSVLGFESFMLFLLLMSGSAVYFRRKQTVATAGIGAGWIQINSRF